MFESLYSDQTTPAFQKVGVFRPDTFPDTIYPSQQNFSRLDSLKQSSAIAFTWEG